MEYVTILGTACEAHHCPACGVAYTVPRVVIENHRQKGGHHFCSNGHSLGWDKDGDTEMNRLRRERDRLKQNEARLLQEKDDLAAVGRKALDDLQRHKKRAAAGTCPCCKRTFANMARHIKSKHPNFNVVPIKAAGVG